MNINGTEYIARIEKEYKEKKAEGYNLPPHVDLSEDSGFITERIMRMGQEVSLYELEPDEYHQMARATIIDDYLHSPHLAGAYKQQ